MGRKIPAPIKAAARAAFFMYESIAEIAARHDLSENTIHKWVYGQEGTPKEKTWLHQRAQKTRELASEVYDDEAKRHIVKLWRVSMPALVKAVKFRADMAMSLTIDEAEAVTRILMSFDKLRRLDVEDQPNLLPDVPRPYTMQELQEAITRDKFFSVHLHVHQSAAAGAQAKDVGPPLPADPFAPKGGEE